MQVHILPFPPINQIRGRSSTELEQLATNEQVVDSSPSVFTNFFRGRLIGRTSGFESENTGSSPVPEAISNAE